MRALRRPVPPSPAPLPGLAALLVAGGDGRLLLDDASGLNPYGCRPAPRPEALNFSSSTASTISEPAWRHAQSAWRRIAADGVAACAALAEDNRVALARFLGLGGTGAAVVFAPSGTDAALHALAVARTVLAAPLVSILAAADETGSGMRHAVSGRHFASVAAQGRAVVAGEPIAGLGERVALRTVALRDETGALRPGEALDREIYAAVAAAVAAGQRVVLYAMDHSKLGNGCPSAVCLAEIGATFGASVRIVVDACQARLGLSRLHWHLERGHMVLVTGSKFFAGPPLSGALLIPAPLAQRMAEGAALPPGLADYAVAGDWPADWRHARAGLSRRGNPGQTLRWSAALDEMAAWLAAPAWRRHAALAGFAAAVPRALAGFAEFEPLARTAEPTIDDAFPVPTIFPFLVRHDGTALSPALCGKLYRALNRDATALLPAGLDGFERRLAALPCHIGQPVAIPGRDGPRGALRVSASARVLREPRDTEQELALVFAKLRLLLRHFDAVERAQ